MGNIESIGSEAETPHLAENYEPEIKSNGAVRAERCRQKKKDAGLVPIYVPASVAAEIKAAGAFDAWQKQFWHRPPEPEAKRIQKALDLVTEIFRLPYWQRWILLRWLSHNRTT